MFSGSGDGMGNKVFVIGRRLSELVQKPFPINDTEIEWDVFAEVDPFDKVLKPSSADFISVYFSRAGAVVQDITGLTLGEYREKHLDREIMVDYEYFYTVPLLIK